MCMKKKVQYKTWIVGVRLHWLNFYSDRCILYRWFFIEDFFDFNSKYVVINYNSSLLYWFLGQMMFHGSAVLLYFDGDSGLWGTVCDDNFDENEVNDVCFYYIHTKMVFV